MIDEDVPPLSPAQQRPAAADWMVLATMLLLGCLGIFLSHDLDGEGMVRSRLPQWAGYMAFIALTVPVTFRRRAPLWVGMGIGVGFAVFRLLEVPEGTVSALVLFLAIHAVGAYGRSARSRNVVRTVALAAGVVALAIGLLQEVEAVSLDGMVGLTFTVGINAAFYAAAWLLGDAARRQRATQDQLARRAKELAVEREKVAGQAVTEERVRIARELHDVVAHHVSVMGVQAAAARHVVDRDPRGAAQAMAHVEDSAREAVHELQRLVAMLRSETEAGVPQPQPMLEDLDRMVTQSRETGLDVTLRRIGRVRPVPSAVALSAYRIIQEGLTNVRRHAPGAAATVVLTYLPDTLQVEVVNGAPTTGPRAGPGGGRGLLGMRERVSLLGGTLATERVSGGGFRVVARLPAEPVHAPDMVAGVLT
ncbi:MAG TPA: histidine kinase [Euzebya sp.]|nr:histidine kinase [Euzebya sp.]